MFMLQLNADIRKLSEDFRSSFASPIPSSDLFALISVNHAVWVLETDKQMLDLRQPYTWVHFNGAEITLVLDVNVKMWVEEIK